ncbi:hypothetical protein ACFVTX_17065 [Agromyces sp. NPDC058136]|uniref:hypothetical protein n=1 Tax=Agromyces sp. NPDC058136 TaxID=3346354 RepID=UPI0036DA2AAE
MTSSNEPQLTRRELRELERLREQQAGTATPDAGAPAYAAPAAPVAPAPAPVAPQPQPQYSQPVAVPQSAPQRMPVHPGQFSAPVSAAPPVAAAPAPAPAPSFAPQQPSGGFAPPAPAVPVQPQPPFGARPAAPPAPVPAAPQPAAPQAAAGPQASAGSAPERTLTRRELRAMLDGVQLDDFDDELDELDSSPLPAPAPTAAPSPTFGGVSAPAAQPHQQMPQRPGPAPVQPTAPFAAAGVTDSGSLNLPGVSAGTPGHWTSQLNVPDVEDRAEPFDQMLSRGGVSHGVPTTTNALILPSLPDQGSFANQLAQPGEVLATGSIDLPRSYGATGVHPSHVDSSEVDRLFEHQVEDVGTGVAPVAATRAISTQGASRTMIAPPKKEGMNVPLVLAVTAGVLALGVVGTLVIGAMTGLF